MILRLVKNFFTPDELWGRQNRSQLIIGLTSIVIYLLANYLTKNENPNWNPFIYSSNGLLFVVYCCVIFTVLRIVIDTFTRSSSRSPWYERYMPIIITLLGIVTLIAFQNINGSGFDDAGLWINIVVLLIVFIIAAGHFVEGSSNERVIKMWFALLGYFFSVFSFFYFLEIWLIK